MHNLTFLLSSTDCFFGTQFKLFSIVDKINVRYDIFSTHLNISPELIPLLGADQGQCTVVKEVKDVAVHHADQHRWSEEQQCPNNAKLRERDILRSEIIYYVISANLTEHNEVP